MAQIDALIQSNYTSTVDPTDHKKRLASLTPSNDDNLSGELQARAQELQNALEALRDLPQPVTAEELEQSGLLSGIEELFVGGGFGDPNPGLITIITSMENSNDNYIKSIVKSPAFVQLVNAIGNSTFNGQTMVEAIEADQGNGDPNDTQLAIFLATMLNQNPQTVFNNMLSAAGKLG